MLKEFLNNSYLFGGNAPFIEDLYEKYLANPQSIPEEWRDYFDRMQVLPGSSDKDVAHAPVVESFVQRALGIPVAMFTCIFSLARTIGWIAQLNEMIGDPEYKIGRPRQLYIGANRRDVKPIDKR